MNENSHRINQSEQRNIYALFIRWLFLPLALILTLYVLLTYRVTMDDFFITMRYARNLADGNGFVFNPGERVLGTTTPLLCLLMAVFSFFGMSEILAAKLICSLALFGASIYIYRYFKLTRQEPLGFAAGLLVFFIMPLKQLWGNEVPLCIFFIIGSLYYYKKEKWAVSAMFQSFYALTRMEGLLFLFILNALLFWKKRKIIRGTLIPPTLILLPWFIFSYLYFGDFFPNTLYAKAKQGGVEIWSPFSVYFIKTLKLLFLNGQWPFMSLLAWFGIFQLMKNRHFLLLSWIGIHQLSYLIIGVPGNYEWYFYPLWILFPLTVAGGIHFFAGSADKLKLIRGRCKIVFAAFLCFMIFISLRQPYLNGFFLSRYNLYKTSTSYITEHYEGKMEVIADEIGIFGYYLPEKIILDTAGLVHADIPPDAYYRYEYLVETRNPKLIVQCLYFYDEEKRGDPARSLDVNISSGLSIKYDFVRLFNHARIDLMVRILERSR